MDLPTVHSAINVSNNMPGDQPQVLVTDSEKEMTGDDAAWIITNAFIIFTMQTGFGLLESACVSRKNEVNIMVKNVVDIVFGGLTYWMFGFGLSFGTDAGTNPFCGVGSFFVDSSDQANIGTVFATFIFQLSFATTATTIVSGAMAERCNFNAYCIFSFLNTIVYCVPAGWLWGKHGFLNQMGVIDIAGSGGVHLVGGISALVSAAMLGPRHGRYDHGTDAIPMGSPTNAVLGLFVLWWGWLSFNCGSTFGVTNHRWKHAARAAASTLTASFGGGIVGMFYSYFTKNGKWDVGLLINSILSSLVAVTAGCSLYHPWEGIVIGLISAIATCLFTPLMDKAKIDDPVGAVAVHAVGGVWGVAAVGLFPDGDSIADLNSNRVGLFKGGGWRMLGVQLLACVCLSAWSAITTFLLLFVINLFVPIRMSLEDEILGADAVEHNVYLEGFHIPPTPHPSPYSRRQSSTMSAAIKKITKIEEEKNMYYKNKRKSSKFGKSVKNGLMKLNGNVAPLHQSNFSTPKFAWVNGMVD